MTFLLDTVAFVRALGNDLPRKLSRRLDKPDTQIFVSIVTPWEMALKRALKQQFTVDRIQQGLEDLGAKLLPITMEHTTILAMLPEFREHRDPFDRMLIAQALDERCPVVSSDERFRLYRSVGLEVAWE